MQLVSIICLSLLKTFPDRNLVGSLVGLALICLLAFLWRKGKIRKPSFPALPSAFTGRGSGMSRLTSPFSRFQSPLSTFQVFLRRRASDSSSEKDPMAETYPNISSESPSRSPRHSFSQVLYDVDRDREIEEVQSMDGGFMRTLSTVIEESKGSTRRTSLRSDPPLTYPDSIHTRSSGLLPSEAGDESRSSSETRTILLPPPFPTASRRSSDPVSPVSPEVRTNSGYGPWRDSMWSFNPTPINGPSPRTSYFRTTSRDFLSPSDRISKSSVYSQDAPRFRTVDSWVGNQSSRTNPSQALTSNPPSSALRAMPGRSHQRHQAQPQIPSQFVGSGSLYSPRARRSTVGDSAWPAALQPPLSPGQHRRDDSSSTATIFRQHPGDLVQL